MKLLRDLLEKRFLNVTKKLEEEKRSQERLLRDLLERRLNPTEKRVQEKRSQEKLLWDLLEKRLLNVNEKRQCRDGGDGCQSDSQVMVKLFFKSFCPLLLSVKRLATCSTRGGSQEMYIAFASAMRIRQNPLWL